MQYSRTAGRDAGSFNSRSYLLLAALAIVLTIVSASTATAQLKAAAAGVNVTLSWTAPGDDGNVGTAAQYDLRYATVPITDANWSAATSVLNVPSPEIAGTEQQCSVGNLDYSTTYYFAIRAADEADNWSPLSNVVSLTTGSEPYAPANVTDLHALATTETSITLGWTAPGDDSTSGTASQYELRYSTSPITALNFSQATLVNGVPAPGPAGSEDSVTVSGLETGTTYYFALITADEVPNWSGLSNVAAIATSSDTTAPAAISDLSSL